MNFKNDINKKIIKNSDFNIVDGLIKINTDFYF